MNGEELVFFSILYTKLFELGVEVAFNNRSAVTHHKVSVPKFPLWSSAPMMLLCCSFASAFSTSRNHLSLSVDRLDYEIYTICISSLIATPSSRLPQK